MSYNLITFSNYFHWVYTKNGCLVRAAIGVSVTMLLIIQENDEMFSISRKIFSEILSFQDLILVTGGYWDNKYHYLVPSPPRGETRSIKDLILGFGFIRNMAKEAFLENLYHQG